MRHFYLKKITFLVVSFFIVSISFSQSFNQLQTLTGVQNGSVDFGDIDGDQDLDLILIGQNSSFEPIANLYTNNGNGSFSLVSQTPFEKVAYGGVKFIDVDNTNGPDIIITGANANFEPTANLYLNDGNGNFSLVPGTPFLGVNYSSVAIIDADGDTHNDILITGENSSFQGTTNLYLNDGSGNFVLSTGTSYEGLSDGSIAVANVDGQNGEDILITGWNSSFLPVTKLYLNNGNGTFQASSNIFTDVHVSSVVFEDVDGDSNPDLLLSGATRTGQVTELYINSGNGTFTLDSNNSFPGLRFSSIDLADINGNNTSDLIISGRNEFGQKITNLYTNDGSGIFTLVQSSLPTVDNGFLKFGEINGDSKPDLILTGQNISNSPVTFLYENTTIITPSCTNEVKTKNLIVQLDTTGTAKISPSDVDNGSTNSCGIQSMSLDVDTFSCDNIGTPVDVTLTVTDIYNNSSSATARVTVEDNLAPVVSTKDITVQLGADGTAAIILSDIDNGSSDNCEISTMSLDIDSFSCDNIGTPVDVTLTVTDIYNNSSSASAKVTVEDRTVPAVVTQNIQVQLDEEGNASITPAMINNGSVDACGISEMSLDNATFDCSDIGENTVVLTVTDNNGNLDSAEATVTVEDKVKPVVITQTITVQLDTEGNATITPAMIDSGSNDACGISEMSLDNATFDCSDIGENTITLTVIDNNGNVDSAEATVTVEDNVAPVVVTRNISVQLDADGTASILPEDVVASANDNCEVKSITLSENTFDCTAGTTIDIKVTVTDIHGNHTSSEVEVTILDDIAPVVITKDIEVELDENGQVSISAEDVFEDAFDNCGIASMRLDITSFGCGQEGTNFVVLSITDFSGNTGTAEAIVEVLNNFGDNDSDGLKDNCDEDDDNDGIPDDVDNAPIDSNPDQTDTDGDGEGDVIDPDDDGDGVEDDQDNCPLTYNPDQGDIDKDEMGDVCDTVEILASEAMTPNGDGINDTWRVINIENHPNALVIIYNRWGKEIYRKSSYRNDWDGRYNGDMLPEGSYYFQIYLDGKNMDKDGWLYLTK